MKFREVDSNASYGDENGVEIFFLKIICEGTLEEYEALMDLEDKDIIIKEVTK